MAPYYDGDGYHYGLDDSPLLCPASPLPMLSAEDYCPPIAAAPPPAHLIGRSSIDELIDGSYCHGALDAAADCPSSALMNLSTRATTTCRSSVCHHRQPAISTSPSINSRPYPRTARRWASTTPPLLPLGDIDLEAFDNAATADEDTPPHHDGHAMIVPGLPADKHAVGQEYAGLDDDYAEQKPMVIAGSFLPGPGGANDAFESAARHRREASSVAAAQLAPPLPPPRGRRSGAGRGHRSPAPALGKTRLDHIGFEELRRYFYMPITRAAREMNVGLTVLKKRCRELGIARWPHRKMKSLKSLILNVQEMAGAGMNNPEAVRQELEALETYCVLMEENPAIELTERTKKLRQACFKESYKRRRAAAVSVVDHIFSFGDQQYHHQLTPPLSSADDGHGQGSGVFGY
ncbi:unnamed protein product [Urochloa decumbens]|uniref:RWP-RK domain-containing protein n=1 Tax=Urochloa decumbens TaxID=240449 RepID=A0ABC8YXN3_9POAL